MVVAQTLDREQTDFYKMTLFCEDAGSPRLNATAVFDVTVEDVNDNSPTFQRDDVTVSIPEGNAVGDVLMMITATDRDVGNNAKIHYTLIGQLGRC